MRRIHSKVTGVTFNDRQQVVAQLSRGFKLFYKREPDNEYDKNAISLYADPGKTLEVGHVKRELAEKVAPLIDAGVKVDVAVIGVTGGVGSQSYGCNIVIVIDDGEKSEEQE